MEVTVEKNDTSSFVFSVKCGEQCGGECRKKNLCFFFFLIDFFFFLKKKVHIITEEKDENVIKKNIEMCIKTCNEKDSEMQCKLGLCFYFGKYVEKNQDEAIRRLILSIQNGYMKALVVLAAIYRERKENDKFLQLVEEYKETRPDCQYLLGRYYEDRKEYEKAFQMFEKAAAEKSEMACWKLGVYLFEGKGCVKDRTRAFDMFRFIHQQGMWEGTYHMAYCYYYGKGVDKNIPEAIRLYLSILEKNPSGYIHYELACCYYDDHQYTNAFLHFQKAKNLFSPDKDSQFLNEIEDYMDRGYAHETAEIQLTINQYRTSLNQWIDEMPQN